MSAKQAFDAMAEFIWRYSERAGYDLATLLGDTGRLPNGETADPASWGDWMECVRHVQQGLPIRNGEWI